MPKRRQSQFEAGRYYLAKRVNSEQWCAAWFDPRSRQTRKRSLGTGDRAEAERRLMAFAYEQGHLVNDSAAPLLAQVFAAYYHQHGKGTRRAPQIARSIERIGADLGHVPISSVRPGMFEDWGRVQMRSGASSSYVRTMLTDARSALNHARKRGDLQAVPFVPVDKFPDGAPREATFSAEQARAFWQAIDSEALARFFILAANTGARTEALLALTPFSIDRNHRLLHLLPPGERQSKKRRPTLPITATLWPWIEAAHGKTLVGRSKVTIQRAWRATRDRADLPSDFVPTSWRHTLHSLFWAADVPENQIADWFMRGATDRMTEHYIKREVRNGRYLTDCVAAIDGLMNEIGRGGSPGLFPKSTACVRAAC